MRKLLTGLAGVAALAATFAGPNAASASETRFTEVAGVEGLYRVTGTSGDVIAQDAYDRCGAGTCFFQHYGGEGLLWVVPSCGRHHVPGYLDGKATSAWNRTPTPIVLYDGTYTGRLGTMPGWFKGDLHPAHDNKLSSVDAAC
ncbi:peptidase inhibitor family I36 protein [Streptomyces botrytidirepellens]|uniref:peptidase inhibitor family I36 protein n=1 Tax=Streptomyces botrytidirepellens TaxID=2486417 RepID=UPI001617C8D2|nr:peptidase inhibitor family I36 protein [Streptomyces botrytidirepellens]